MARKLKTYTTSAGFFDLAIAAPSMKAALEAWGSSNNLFHQGFARQSDDPKIVAATMAKPGVVLRRAVGTDAAYSEKAELPTNLPVGKMRRAPVAARPKAATAPKSTPPKPIDEKTAREAALAYEREQKRREQEARREEAAREKERERRDRAIAAAEAALEEARRAHEARVAEMEKARLALDRKAAAEEAHWEKKKDQLESALRRARSPKHLRLV